MKKDKTINDELPVPETEKTADNTDKKDNKKKKIAVIAALLSLCVIGGLSWFLLYGLPEKDQNPMFDKEKQEEIIGMYGSTQTYLYYPIDYDLDIMSEKEYLDLDRNIYYTKGSETIALTPETLSLYPDDVVFFTSYFDLAIKGEYQKYNALFTENYYESNEPYYSFTQQMIYDIHIEKLAEGKAGDNDSYTYNVSYKIHRNNGTFRNDIDSDGSKTLCYTLVKVDGKILIDSINYYKSK